MSGFQRQDRRWLCDDVSIDDLASVYGTPLYVYSRARIEENFKRVSDAFKPLSAHIHYSVKANSSGAILRILHDLGSGFDVVSGGELYRVLRAGADPASIVFAGVGKAEDELIYALEQHVGWINVESVQELELLDRLANDEHVQPNVALRINPSVEADTHHHIATGGRRSKFGIDLEDARLVFTQPDRFPRLDLAGLHVHIGSQLASPDGTIDAVRRVMELARLHPIRMLDIGGGFPVAYRPGDDVPEPGVFAEAIIQLLSAPDNVIRNERGRQVEVAVEPGRSIIADAGAMIATVQYVKMREGRRIVIVDAGMAELIRPALYDAYHHIVAVRDGEPAPVLADVVGPVCETSDTLGYDRELPEVQRGDRLLILNAGAYGMAMASNYNSRARPAEVMVEGTAHHLIRRRERWEDLTRWEV